MRNLVLYLFLLATPALAHVPALLPAIEGTPITSYFIGQSDVSRAIYSELDEENSMLVVHFQVITGAEKTLLQLLTPLCQNIAAYESFQPSALLLAGELPWKTEGESDKQYLVRLKKEAQLILSSDYAAGERPKFYEEYGDQTYWEGAKWQGDLKPGLYGLVVFDEAGTQGNFTVGLNEKEAWTPELFEYVGKIMPRLKAGICSPDGFFD